MVDSFCTPLKLIETCNECDCNWENYKPGYQKCVMNAAEHFWREYACSEEAVTKLNFACKACKQQFKKT